MAYRVLAVQNLKKNNKKEEDGEVTELVDYDGTWLTSSIGLQDPASTVQGFTSTEKTVAMSRNPRDPLLRGWYGYYGEGHVKEEDMSKAFGYEKTKDLDAKETIKFYKGDFINVNPLIKLTENFEYFDYVEEHSSTKKYIDVMKSIVKKQ